MKDGIITLNAIPIKINAKYPSKNEMWTLKRFMKLLQAEGIQRNEINKIVEDNKEKYTYARLYNTVNEHL